MQIQMNNTCGTNAHLLGAIIILKIFNYNIVIIIFLQKRQAKNIPNF